MSKQSAKLNPTLLDLEIYASKAISLEAKKNPDIVGLSFGEPEFGPPDYALVDIAGKDLTIESFLSSVKRYEDPRGSIELRIAISNWYMNRYGIEINPETEIMVTHGGVEAITLSILCTTEVGDSITVTDPSYMLYERAITTLGRSCHPVKRTPGEFEYKTIFEDQEILKSDFNKSKAMIINSPENPSGYVVDQSEWDLIADYSNENGLWVIHDEVYDTMALERKHIPFRAAETLPKNHIIINSFSKKFGIPGLRIGWMVANPQVIELSSKIHDYLYLGVNIQYEQIATRLITDDRNEEWLLANAQKIQKRANRAMNVLGEEQGFTWPRKPLGAMFLFPNVRKLYEKMPASYKEAGVTCGDAVAKFLLKEKKVAVVPGSVYGLASSEHIRLVLCTTDKEFDLALERLSS